MPFLAPVFAAVGAAATSLGISASMVVNLLINVGLALIQMLLMKQPKPEDVNNVVRQSTPIRQVHLGRVRTGGPVLFIESNARILYQVVYFSEGPADGYEEFFVDNRTITLGEEGWVTSPPYGSKGERRVQILGRAGDDPSTVYEPLKLAFPGVVNNQWRGDGLATAMISAKTIKPAFIAKHYPNRIPQLNVIGRFGRVYDPRSGNRVWSQNLPLLLLEYLTSSDGLSIPQKDVDPTDTNDLIDLSDFAFAARVADELIQTKNGGSTRRYHGSLSWRLDEQPKDIIQRALMMMDGQLYLKPSGKIGFRIGRWEAPTVHILDTDILDAELRDASAPVSEANEIVIKWTNPNSNYSSATSDPWRNEEAYRRAGGRFRNTTVELYGIQSHNHARRVAKILDRRLNARWQGTIRTSLAGMLAWDQRFIRVSYTDLGIDAETFEVLAISMDEEDMTLTLQITSIDATIYDFDPQTEEGTEPVNPDSLGDDAIATPANLKISFDAETVRNRRIITATLSVDKPRRNFNDPSREDDDEDDLTAEWQYCRADSGRWRTVTYDDEEFTVEIDDLVETRLYDFRVRFRAATSEPGDWLLAENVRAIDPDPPGRPTSVRVSVVPTGVKVTLKAPSDVQMAQIQIWRDANNSWRGSDLLATVDCAPGEAFSWIDTNPKANQRFYYAAALNGSGVRSQVVPAVNNPVRFR